MKQLGARNYALISSGVNVYGTFNPEEIFFVFEEELYVNEATEIWNFLEWCHKNNKRFGRSNYENVFSEFKNSDKK